MSTTDRMRERIRLDAALNNGVMTRAAVTSPSRGPSAPSQDRKSDIIRDRQSLVLWRRPLMTIYYFLLELIITMRDYGRKLLLHKKLLGALIVVTFVVLLVYNVKGPHQPYVLSFRKQFLWCSYWVGLGVLSSVGLGTGLHTFVLYLGPHIAAVTLAAFECMSVDFPTPPYPDEIVCPDTMESAMSLWTIMSKVRLEAFMWGAGTAIGELPPYFMARASRLSGQADEEEDDLAALTRDPTNLGLVDRAKLFVHRLVHRVGFAGILLCASIPNPLFDLAGITCGHFLIPFWTFFGATLIGKAVFKMHIQKLFVIFVFSEKHVEGLVRLIGLVPKYGASLEAPFKEYLAAQKLKMHRGKEMNGVPGEVGGENWLSWVFEKVVIVMVAYFVLSIVNSFAQSYHRRISEADVKKRAID